MRVRSESEEDLCQSYCTSKESQKSKVCIAILHGRMEVRRNINSNKGEDVETICESREEERQGGRRG
jgi:hypothetical protein